MQFPSRSKRKPPQNEESVSTACSSTCFQDNVIMFTYTQGDEAELAKKIATLQWHEKEMEVRPCQ